MHLHMQSITLSFMLLAGLSNAANSIASQLGEAEELQGREMMGSSHDIIIY